MGSKAIHGEVRTAWRALRGAMWLAHAVWLSELSANDFAKKFIERGRSASNLMLKWRSGGVLPSQASALALEKQLPGTAWLFDLPLFPLLDSRRFTRNELTRVLAPWQRTAGHPADPEWKLPPDSSGRTVFAAIDTGALLARGDIWGLAGIVASARMAESQHNEAWHASAIADAFRALPALLMAPWSRDSTASLYALLSSLQERVTYSRLTFAASWATIERLASTDGYDPDPLRRTAARGTAYSMFPDPIVYMKSVPSRRLSRW